MVVYELKGKNFESSEYTVIQTITAQSGILDFLTIPKEYQEMYDIVYWEETGYENERIRDLGGYYEGM